MSVDVKCHLVEIKLIKTWLGYIIDGLACCLNTLNIKRTKSKIFEASTIICFTDPGQSCVRAEGGAWSRDTRDMFVTSYDSLSPL